MFGKLKLFVYDGLENHKSKQFKFVHILLSLATAVSIISIILETVRPLEVYYPAFLFIEWVTVFVFTLEYLARITVSQKKFEYIFSFWGVLDLVCILPTFLGLGNWTFLKSLRMLRLLRLVRTLRLAKISEAYLETKSKAKSQRDLNQINTAIYFLAVVSSTILFGSILYVLEEPAEAYSSIPLAMLQVASMLVGGNYVSAVTLIGSLAVIVTKLVGLALFGLLISIISGVLSEWLLGTRERTN